MTLPYVRLSFVCVGAEHDPDDGSPLIRHPLTLVRRPPGANEKYRIPGLAVYAEYASGVGQFDISVQVFVHRRGADDSADGEGVPIGRTEAERRTVRPGVTSTASLFRFEDLPCPRPALFRFQAMGNHTALPGTVAELRVLDAEGQS